MKRMICCFLIFSTCLLIAGCQKSGKENNNQKKKEELNMTEEKLYDIYHLFEAPKASKKQALTEVIKVVFSKNNSSTSDTIAIDIQNSKIYVDPWTSALGINYTGGTKEIRDTKIVLEILRKYNVQDWKEDYTFEDPLSYVDGYGWNLWLQFEDGTVEKHGGSGGLKSGIVPENFDEFFTELNNFVEECLKDQ